MSVMAITRDCDERGDSVIPAPLITTGGDKVQISGAVVTMESVGHVDG